MDLSPEDRLLLCCSRTHMSREVADEVKGLLRSEIDWSRVLDRANRHGITPLLYFNLGRIRENGLPNGVLQRLTNAYYSSLRRNALLYAELKAILNAFEEAGVRAIILKGAVLAESVYLNMALRPVGDIDLLVTRRDLYSVKEVLPRLGYKGSPPVPVFSKVDTEWEEYEILSYAKQARGIVIDLDIHIDAVTTSLALLFEVHSGVKVRADAMWKNARPAVIAGAQALILSPEDLLLHLCLHSIKHVYDGSGSRLLWWCDIAEVERCYREEMDWRYVIQYSKDCRIETPVYYGLALANTWFETQIPQDVLNLLRATDRVIPIEEVAEAIMHGTPCLQVYARSHLAFFSRVHGMWGKMGYAFRLFFPRKAFMRERYGKRQSGRTYRYYSIRFRKGMRALQHLLRSRLKRPMLPN